MGPAVVWFRRDLRLGDHPALRAAAAAGGARGVVGLFVVDPALARPAGRPRAAFLGACLEALDAQMGGRLVLRHGAPASAVAQLAAEVGAEKVFVSADGAPYGRRRDRAVRAALARDGRELVGVGTPYAVDPGEIRSTAGEPYRVFGPFYRAWEVRGWPPPLAVASVRWRTVSSDTDLGMLGAMAGTARPGWWKGLPEGVPVLWPAGEEAAWGRLERFVEGPLAGYREDRDRPGVEGTSRLSADLHFGVLHPRQVLDRLGRGPGGAPGGGPGPSAFRRQLAWREFYADVLFHKPASARRALAPAMGHLKVDRDRAAQERFGRWARGQTGYPLVDAAARQLLGEGWVHNRGRMVAASFLVKDLHLPWRWGARWFMDRLVDGDLASNQHGWQWVAGTGTDAAPFHRIFNPATQASRFDPEGRYVARWVPELPARPGPGGPEGTSGSGRADGHERGAGPARYPDPMVDHAAERREALARAAAARRGTR